MCISTYKHIRRSCIFNYVGKTGAGKKFEDYIE